MNAAAAKQPHAQQGPQSPQPAQPKPGYPGAPDDTWKKDSDPHPITPGKPAPTGPDEQKKAQLTLVAQEPSSRLEVTPFYQVGAAMPAPTFATGSTLMNPYRHPLAGPTPTAGPQTPPMGPVGAATPTISSPSPLPGATHGVAYSAYTFGVTGGVQPYSWTATGVPAGMTLSTAGVLSGTPTTAGSPSISVTVTDSATPSNQTNNKVFALTIA